MKKNTTYILEMIFLMLMTGITFAQLKNSSIIGWVIRDKDINVQVNGNISDYFYLNDTSKINSNSFNEDVIVFKDKRAPNPEYSICGLKTGNLTIWGIDSTYIVLGKTLYDFIKERDKYRWEKFEVDEGDGSSALSNPNYTKSEGIYWWSNNKANLSLFHPVVKFFNTGYGIDGNIGLDQLNYPFWFSGVWRAGFISPKIRFGVQAPLPIGYPAKSMRERLLDAGYGGYVDFNIDGFSGGLFYSDYSKKGNESLYKRGSNSSLLYDSIYYLSFGGNLGYSFYPNINGFLNVSLRIFVGAEFHQVGEGYVEVSDPKNVKKRKGNNIGSPMLRFDLFDLKENYEAFFQFSNYSLMFGGAYNITKALGIEFRYVVIEPLRKRNPWEQSNMFMISPRLRFN